MASVPSDWICSDNKVVCAEANKLIIVMQLAVQKAVQLAVQKAVQLAVLNAQFLHTDFTLPVQKNCRTL